MEVVKAPNPKLRVKTKPVKKVGQALKNTLKEMIKLTKTFKDPEGVGLAATQIGRDESYFVGRLHDSKTTPLSKPGQRKNRWAGYDKEFSAIINPKILSYGKHTRTYFEGCLSIPNTWGQVKRHTNIKVYYQNSDGEQVTRTLKGIPAWIFQHETDHLNGILFSDRVLEQKGKFYRFTGKDKTGTDLFEEITI
ncbi:MAG: peptide deformylase [Candidatus Daviesbacteria bacterium]|nr:peptide deformylase [Candidatus Daviesbacteria bacterium]